jgi:teichuronic acid exporter
VVQRIAWWANSSSDMLVAGRTLGSELAGGYSLAWLLADTPVQKVNEIVLRVAPGVFPAVQEDNAVLRRYLLTCVQAVTLIVVPATVGVALVSREFVLTILGIKWLILVQPLQALAINSAIRSSTPVFAMLLNVRREAAFVARMNIVATMVMLIAFYIGSGYGVTGIALAWLIVNPFLLWPVLRKTFDNIAMRPLDFFAAVAPAFAGAIGMAAAVLGAGFFPPMSALPPAAGLALKVALGAITYAAILWIFFPSKIRGATAILSRLAPSRPTGSA